MANIVIKDLTEDTELDRRAMRAVVGGRAGSRLGITAPRPGHFQHPLAVTVIRLLPDAGFASSL